MKKIYKPIYELKGSKDPKQLTARLNSNPEVFEFYTDYKDFTTEKKEFENALKLALKTVEKENLIIHAPIRLDNGEYLNLTYDDESTQFKKSDAIIKEMMRLSIKYKVRCLLHPMYWMVDGDDRDLDMNAMIPGRDITWRQLEFARMDYYYKISKGYLMFENSISTAFNYEDREITDLLVAHRYPLVFNVSHEFISQKGNNDKLIESMELLKELVVHYHIVDSMGQEHDSLDLSDGLIDWERVLESMNEDATMIYEVIEDMSLDVHNNDHSDKSH